MFNVSFILSTIINVDSALLSHFLLNLLNFAPFFKSIKPQYVTNEVGFLPLHLKRLSCILLQIKGIRIYSHPLRIDLVYLPSYVCA